MSEKDIKELLKLYFDANEDIKNRAVQILKESQQPVESPDLHSHTVQ